jgi:hypothetical protein
VQPNWAFIVGTFIVLVAFNFGIVGLFVYLRDRSQMKVASGEGEGGRLYYDKVASQEERDRQGRSCLSCLSSRVQRLSATLGKEGVEEAAPLEKGPRYDDLVQLLSDFRSEYDVLRGQLKAAQEAQDEADASER